LRGNEDGTLRVLYRRGASAWAFPRRSVGTRVYVGWVSFLNPLDIGDDAIAEIRVANAT